MKKPKVPLTQERVRELFDYDPETGIVTRRVGRGNQTKVGDKVGSLDKSTGYLTTRIDDRSFYLHRVIFLHVHGYMPEYQVDHINRLRTDNRACNLRESTYSCNSRNSVIRYNNTSGVKGVSWISQKGRWVVQIFINGRGRSLGRYKDFTEAVAVRLAAEQVLNWAGCDSNSSAFLYMQKYLKGEL